MMPEREPFWPFETPLDVPASVAEATEYHNLGKKWPQAIFHALIRGNMDRYMAITYSLTPPDSPAAHDRVTALNSYQLTLTQIDRAQKILDGQDWFSEEELEVLKKIPRATETPTKTLNEDSQDLAKILDKDPTGVAVLKHYVQTLFFRSLVGPEGWDLREWAIKHQIASANDLVENVHDIPRADHRGRIQALIDFQRLTEHLASF